MSKADPIGSATGRPSELAIVVAAIPGGSDSAHSGWRRADEVRGRLGRLGFEATTQQVAASLTRMSKVDCPWVERRQVWEGPWEYRVTQFGLTDLHNRLPGVRLYTPWIPTMRGASGTGEP